MRIQLGHRDRDFRLFCCGIMNPNAADSAPLLEDIDLIKAFFCEKVSGTLSLYEE